MNTKFKNALIQASQDKKELDILKEKIEAFKKEFGSMLSEGDKIKLATGEQFSKGSSTPPKKVFKLEEAMNWFYNGIIDGRVTRKEFNSITKKDNGRSAGLFLK